MRRLPGSAVGFVVWAGRAALTGQEYRLGEVLQVACGLLAGSRGLGLAIVRVTALARGEVVTPEDVSPGRRAVVWLPLARG